MSDAPPVEPNPITLAGTTPEPTGQWEVLPANLQRYTLAAAIDPPTAAWSSYGWLLSAAVPAPTWDSGMHLAGEMPGMVGAFEVVATSQWVIQGTVPGPSASFVGTAGSLFLLAGLIPAAQGAIELVAGAQWRIAAQLPAPSGAFDVAGRQELTLAGVLPPPGAEFITAATVQYAFAGEVPVPLGWLRFRATLRRHGYLMGPSGAIARHSLDATGYAVVAGGTVLALGPSNRTLDGANHAAAMLLTAATDFDLAATKTVREVFIDADLDADLDLASIVDGREYAYRVAYHPNNHTQRITLGRGARGRRWQLRLTGTGGAMHLRALDVLVGVSNTRRSK
ncbi:hypothetical protein [Chitiniphilus eburneus]|uniref:Uncharacterized protein n=1 Tax=Chitiniphilus eburneus TaxID=2571148 RepID=A0A4U0PQP8_9NEIS|nr:hypothetical protein [Chitiniphilus eburneus]TJZ69742.1 hypothetical protein FAZ21_14585 [Chitiniphilus eburneus]